MGDELLVQGNDELIPAEVINIRSVSKQGDSAVYCFFFQFLFQIDIVTRGTYFSS